MTTNDIAEKLVSYCQQASWEAAQNELYADDAVSLESNDSPVFSKETKGRAAIIEKGRKFSAMIEQMHTLEVSAPVVADQSFACTMSLDVTIKGQPRMQMTELCVYEVKDGKIIAERFFP